MSSRQQRSPVVRADNGQQEVDADTLALDAQTEPSDVFFPQTTAMQKQADHWTRMLDEILPASHPPGNFGVVVPGVYRSSFPQPEDYAFIQALRLKTIITLVQKEFPKGYGAFLHKSGINHLVFDMKGTKKEGIPFSTMKSILRIVLDRRNHPLLIHCNHGKHRTGCVVGAIRKLSGWKLGNIIGEYRTFAEPKVRDCDIDYITDFELADISHLFLDPTMPFHHPGFIRATLIAFVMLIVWLLFGVPSPGVVTRRRDHDKD
ncbi:hypothetical protein N658DRAFT_80285 [Parathielavia hyrcaniae]|uniref:diphosphoinositol-polyphosphate diphosphatase n=1 Tax=Parathielavia hyrcaniae TaxID=113614 RepID=A0AAN6Q026_9PEZI|nr:hypothetical protein N658DRAFT_80285 [Parathielavia hyrcaniae]